MKKSLAVAALALYGGLYRSYERTAFQTLHGRTTVLTLTANLGALRRHRSFVPRLSAAIEEAAEQAKKLQEAASAQKTQPLPRV